jgi:hypothetical protein
MSVGRDLAEHSPLSRLDEYPIHQTTEPLRLVAATDPRAFERYWFTAQDDAGESFLVTGFAVYPNLGTVDGYGLFVHDDHQTTVRAHRPLGLDRSDLSVGPLRIEIIDPFTEWRLSLGDNPQGLRFDLRWRDTKRAVFQRATFEIPGLLSTRLYHDWAGYETFGTIEGSVVFRGKTLRLDPAHVRGSRDHHWGVRDGVGGRGHMLAEPQGSSHLGQWVEFGDWSIWGSRVLYGLGDPRPGAGRIEHTDYRLRFDPETKHLRGGVARNYLRGGEVREVTYEPIGNQTAYLRCAMYDGPDGRGTPEEDHHHGESVGERVDGESYDLRDPGVRMRIAGFEDHLVRATCDGETSVGMLECRNPALYEMCRRGVPGFSILD